MAWLNFSVMTIWSAMTPAGGMLPTWRRDYIVGVSFGSDGVSRRHHRSPAQVKQPATLSGCGKQRWLHPRFKSVIPALFWARLVRGAAVHGLRSPGSAFGFEIEIHRLRRSHPSIP